MVNRMKPIISKIISPYQAAFVPGRHIQDNMVIAHELIDTMKTRKDRFGDVAMKLDMSEAVDRLGWKLIADVLPKLGFAKAWCDDYSMC